MGATEQTSGVRRGEIIAALSIATDLSMGQPAEFALKSCVLATRIGRMLGLPAQDLAEIYYQSLLRYIGCNAETHAMAALFGDYLRRGNAGAGMLGMVAGGARGLRTRKGASVENIAGHCEVAERL